MGEVHYGACSICGNETPYACSDCRIERSVTVYVCTKTTCRDAHEALKICAQGPNVVRIHV